MPISQYQTRNAKGRVVFQPSTHRAIQRGVNQLVDAVRPTLGPRPGSVFVDNVEYHDKTPKTMDDGGTIARHINQLPDRDEDVGAMLVRDLLWRLQLQEGDGTATAAVLFQTVYNEGIRYLTSGGNSRRLQSYLNEGVQLIIGQLNNMTVPVEGKRQFASIAEVLCYDPPLAKYLGEIFEIIGEHGRLEIRSGMSRGVEREYLEGMYWEQGPVSREMYTDHSKSRMEFVDAAILISDLEIKDPQQLYAPLEQALKAKIPALLIVAESFSDSAVNFLLTNRQPEKFQAFAVKTPGFDKEQKAAALVDLSILTGGRRFIGIVGDTFEGIRLDDFGRARRVWVEYLNFGIIGGKGNPRALRQHLATLRASFNAAQKIADRNLLQKRIGKLLGGSATLWVGGATTMDIEARVQTAKRAAASLRGAMMEGVLPGGGVALLACRPALQQKLNASTEVDERAAYRILIKATETPFRTIVANAGYDASDIMAEVRLAGEGYGFDVTSAQIVDMMQLGICDPAPVQKGSVYGALSTAAMALTIDVLVHHAELEQAPLPSPATRKQLQD